MQHHQCSGTRVHTQQQLRQLLCMQWQQQCNEDTHGMQARPGLSRVKLRKPSVGFHWRLWPVFAANAPMLIVFVHCPRLPCVPLYVPGSVPAVRIACLCRWWRCFSLRCVTSAAVPFASGAVWAAQSTTHCMWPSTAAVSCSQEGRGHDASRPPWWPSVAGLGGNACVCVVKMVAAVTTAPN